MILLSLLLAITGAVLCHWMAKTRGKDPAVWAVLGFVVPPVSILVLALSKTPTQAPAAHQNQRSMENHGRPPSLRAGHFPSLSAVEWGIYAVLAAALAVTNIYTTLLTGWGDGGSIIAVVASMLLLGAFRRRAHIHSLNLGQTMVSAGGTVGFAASSYAAVRIAFPEYQVDSISLMVMFIGMALIGVVLGTLVRKQMIKYYFPSGTACAVLQRTVTNREGGEDARRPLRLLAIFGGVAALWVIPVKLTLKKGGAALLSKISLGNLHGQALGISLDPTLFGIGIVVGPRVGLGMLLGGMVGPFVLMPALKAFGDGTPTPDWFASIFNNILADAHYTDWKTWCAIAVLTLPTFATLVYAYWFRVPAIIPPGFTPGATEYKTPSTRNLIYGALAIIGVAVTAFTSYQLFDLPWYATILVIGLCFPLSIMNGRVTGETDINPVRLVIIVVLTVFALLLNSSAVMLIGMTLIATMLAGMAVDMMQDYRTGYLVDANPTHQTSVQFIGVLIGALVAIPFVLLLDSYIGFGPNSALPAPGPQIYAHMAKAFSETTYMNGSLLTTIIAVSLGGSLYAFFSTWPKTARWMPSIFGVGIGMLLPFEMSASIFLGGIVKWLVALIMANGLRNEPRDEALNDANNTTMIVGSAIFASAALVSVLMVLLEIAGVIHTAH